MVAQIEQISIISLETYSIVVIGQTEFKQKTWPKKDIDSNFIEN